MTGQLTIQVPYELARYAVSRRRKVNVYETNQLIRAFDTWLILKHITTSGIIQNWNNQKTDLFKICKCSEAIFRHRIRLLKSMQLITADRNNIKPCSWDSLDRILQIDSTKKLAIQYYSNDNAKLFQWIAAAEIKDNQERQGFMINKKLKENPDYYLSVIGAMLQAGADATRLKEPGYILTWMQIMYRDGFIKGSEIYHLLTEIRPDTNRGVKGIAAAWECKHPQTISYWKKILKKSGIIDIDKLMIQSETRQRNKSCHVIWLDTKNIRANYPGRRAKNTMLCLCDQITVLQPWARTNFFINAA